MAILRAERKGWRKGGGRARARERASARGRKSTREKQAGHVYEKKSDRFNAVAAVRCLLIVEFNQFHFFIVLFLGTIVEGFGDLLLKVYHCCCSCWGRFCQVVYRFCLVFSILIKSFFLCSLASVLLLSAIVCSSTSLVVLILSCVRIFVW